VPPVPIMSALVPSGKVPITLLIGRESRVALLVGERVAVMTATSPLLSALAFIPDARQTKVPTPELQLSVFPAAARAELPAALRETTSVGEYVSVHWTAAGSLAAALNERFSKTEPPLSVDPEARLKDGT